LSAIDLVSGQNHIDASITGQESGASDSVTVIVESGEPPRIRFTNTNEPTTQSDTLVLTGLAEDDTKVLKVTWEVGNALASGTAIGTENWIVSPIPLVVGENEITITAEDIFENSSSISYTVTRLELPTEIVEELKDETPEEQAKDLKDPNDTDEDEYMDVDENHPSCGTDPNDPGPGGIPANTFGVRYPADSSSQYYDGDKIKTLPDGQVLGYLWPDCLNPDIDQDGMPNDWESKYGLNPKDPTDANQDLDADDYTNLQEFWNGTDPTKAPAEEAFMVEFFDLADQPIAFSQWLPEYNTTLKVKVTWQDDGAAPDNVSFALLDTSKYPGRAVNDPDPAKSTTTYEDWYDYKGFDFGLTTIASENSYNQGPIEVFDIANGATDGSYSIYLKSLDFGGRARLVISHPTLPDKSVEIWIPNGAGTNGIGSGWQYEDIQNPLNANADVDQITFQNPGVYTAPAGDDFSNFEEYRGIVYTDGIEGDFKHLRLNPHRKDLFIRAEGFDNGADDPYQDPDPNLEDPFSLGTAFLNAGIDIHNTTGWGHDATSDKSFFTYYRSGTISNINKKIVTGLNTDWLTNWPGRIWEFKLDSDPGDLWMPVEVWKGPEELILSFDYKGTTGSLAAGEIYTIRKPVPHIDVLIIRHDRFIEGLFSWEDGHLIFLGASPPTDENKTGSRFWTWSTKGVAKSANPEITYGYAITLKSAIESYLGGDKPYLKGNIWTPTGWQTINETDPGYDPALVEQHRNKLASLDKSEDPTDGILIYSPGLIVNGDRRLGTYPEWNDFGNLNPFDINGNNIYEMPPASNPFEVDPAVEQDQFGVPYTRARVIRHIITHELGHALIGPEHSTEQVNGQFDLLFGFTNDWSRDHLLHDWSRSRIRIHNPKR